MYTCTAHTYVHKMQSHLFAMCAINQTAAGQADDFTEYRFTPRRLNSILCWNTLWAPSSVSIQTCTYTVCTYFLVVLFIVVGGRYVCAVAALWMQFYMNGYKMKFRQCSCFMIKRNQMLVLLKFGFPLKVSYRKLRFVIAVCNCFLCCHQLSRKFPNFFLSMSFAGLHNAHTHQATHSNILPYNMWAQELRVESSPCNEFPHRRRNSSSLGGWPIFTSGTTPLEQHTMTNLSHLATVVFV